ncbi:cytochrome-c peroxidase [Inhella proteolytica]|uniref:C-type cytochrome n=1 Tax=Inhella proteolytica TaxID=2795029 RepID=A0A931J852_9BURK|nr:cytochrome c peroxidase [Inhella proteolytica]MBH9579538.1 c-type cytochrome [Inhella proteolytica]
MRPCRSIPLLIASCLALAACGGGGQEASPTVQAEAARPAPPQPPAPPVPPAPPLPPTPPASVPAPTPAPTPTPDLSARAAVGDQLFHERALSASGQLACASCHDPARGHADPAGRFLPIGGAGHNQQGLRSSPSIRYLDQAGAFTRDAQGQPRGGLMWDGRFNSRVQQAAGPLFAANEMANANLAEFAQRLRATPAYPALLSAYGLPANASDQSLLAASTDALARYQAQDPEFKPFSSKFDAVQDGRASFTAAEARGFAAFNDPQRGNCASCHSSRPAGNGVRALFTDFSYHALGVPRNQSQATLDPSFFDLGLCGPTRSDLAADATLCGRFKTPTLRNVALTGPYFHNARFNSLEEVVSFYALRDVDPARFYPVLNGQVQRFNDLPARYQGNVERRAPFAPLAGNRPRLSAQDVQDLVAFLNTLTDQPN